MRISRAGDRPRPFHMDNCYFYLGGVGLLRAAVHQHLFSNTAFRGLRRPARHGRSRALHRGGRLCDRARPAGVRRRNLAAAILIVKDFGRDVTPYHQRVEDNIAGEVAAELERRCDYQARKVAIREANATSPRRQAGIALTPVKFGISFTATWFNQAGRWHYVHTDGTVALNHGGTEMGQGLYIKVAQVVAHASASGSTVTRSPPPPPPPARCRTPGHRRLLRLTNGTAALDACETIKKRLAKFAAKYRRRAAEEVAFRRGG